MIYNNNIPNIKGYEGIREVVREMDVGEKIELNVERVDVDKAIINLHAEGFNIETIQFSIDPKYLLIERTN